MWKRFVVYMDNSSVLAYACLTGILAWVAIAGIIAGKLLELIAQHVRITIS